MQKKKRNPNKKKKKEQVTTLSGPEPQVLYICKHFKCGFLYLSSEF